MHISAIIVSDLLSASSRKVVTLRLKFPLRKYGFLLQMIILNFYLHHQEMNNFQNKPQVLVNISLNHRLYIKNQLVNQWIIKIIVFQQACNNTNQSKQLWNSKTSQDQVRKTHLCNNKKGIVKQVRTTMNKMNLAVKYQIN